MSQNWSLQRTLRDLRGFCRASPLNGSRLALFTSPPIVHDLGSGTDIWFGVGLWEQVSIRNKSVFSLARFCCMFIVCIRGFVVFVVCGDVVRFCLCGFLFLGMRVRQLTWTLETRNGANLLQSIGILKSDQGDIPGAMSMYERQEHHGRRQT